MKKILFIAMATCSIIVSNAQTEKGSKLIGSYFGAISTSNGSSESRYSNIPSTTYSGENKSFYFDVSPTIMWFVADNFALGGYVNVYFGNSSGKNFNSASTAFSESKSNYFSLGIGPTARYYFKTANKKGIPFAEILLSYYTYPSYKSSGKSSSGSSYTNDYTKYNGTSAAVNFGYEYFVSSNVGLQATIGFRYTSGNYTSDYKPSTGAGYVTTSSNEGMSFPLRVGVQIHLPSKVVTKKK